jgi:hypothetical protein
MNITHGKSIVYDQTLFMCSIQEVHKVHTYPEVTVCICLYASFTTLSYEIIVIAASIRIPLAQYV